LLPDLPPFFACRPSPPPPALPRTGASLGAPSRGCRPAAKEMGARTSLRVGRWPACLLSLGLGAIGDSFPPTQQRHTRGSCGRGTPTRTPPGRGLDAAAAFFSVFFVALARWIASLALALARLSRCAIDFSTGARNQAGNRATAFFYFPVMIYVDTLLRRTPTGSARGTRDLISHLASPFPPSALEQARHLGE